MLCHFSFPLLRLFPLLPFSISDCRFTFSVTWHIYFRSHYSFIFLFLFVNKIYVPSNVLVAVTRAARVLSHTLNAHHFLKPWSTSSLLIGCGNHPSPFAVSLIHFGHMRASSTNSHMDQMHLSPTTASWPVCRQSNVLLKDFTIISGSFIDICREGQHSKPWLHLRGYWF